MLRKRLFTLAIALVLILSAVPVMASGRAVSWTPPSEKVIFFAADGMRQDLVEHYLGQSAFPTLGDAIKYGVWASGNGLLTQAPANTGAGWYTLATGTWSAVHGSTNNTFHSNGQTVRQLAYGGVRHRCAAGGDDRPGRGAGRQEGRPDRMVRRPQWCHQRPHARLPRASSLAVASPPTTSRRPITPPLSPRSACSSTTPRASPARPPSRRPPRLRPRAG